jgi:chromosome segregation ATPase
LVETLKEDLEAARASVATANQELSSKSASFEELVARERGAQNKLQVLGDDKKAQEHVLESTQRMLFRVGLFFNDCDIFGGGPCCGATEELCP